jgi:hypothetical protein
MTESCIDSKSTIFEVINSFRLYDIVCIVSALRPVSMGFHQSFMDINYADVAPY